MGIAYSDPSVFSHWVHRTSEVLEPISQAQLASVLGSQLLVMDETPIRAGRKAKGRMRTASFWPTHGDHHEVVFPYAQSRPCPAEFAGILLSNGYRAYPAYAEHLRRGHESQRAVPGLTRPGTARVPCVLLPREALHTRP